MNQKNPAGQKREDFIKLRPDLDYSKAQNRPKVKPSVIAEIILFTMACLIAVFTLFLWYAEPAEAANDYYDPQAISSSTSVSNAGSESTSSATGGKAVLNGGNVQANPTSNSSANAAGGVGTGYGGSANGASANYQSNFFALARSQPAASGCWGGVDAGGADGSGGGFFGIHILNKNCWAAHLAKTERSVYVRARLKCRDKIFRQAIAYNVRTKKQDYCVREMEREMRQELAFDNELAQQLIKEQERVADLERQLQSVGEVCDERVDRCETALTQDK